MPCPRQESWPTPADESSETQPLERRALPARAADSYDAIFCLALLRRSGLRIRETCLLEIRFEDFERCLEEFSFRFADTAAAPGFGSS
jgi:hypothetical protein